VKVDTNENILSSSDINFGAELEEESKAENKHEETKASS
jgi:hypothetical protein